MSMSDLLSAQRDYFRTGATQPVEARRRALESLKQVLAQQEELLLQALQADLNKSPFEGFLSEVGIVREELGFHLRHLKRWTAPRRVPGALAQLPGRGVILPEPYGVALILVPWNYPIQLALEPLIGALSAGNCAVIKPSEYAPACAKALTALITAAFPPELVQVVEGGVEESQALLDQPFDYIFYTGSAQVGRLVLEKAARHLTPVTLELGGKSPCLVTQHADVSVAARRIVFGKLLNAGQTCVAPDYVLVHSGVRAALLERLQAELTAALGPRPLENLNYPKIISPRHHQRLLDLLEGQHVLVGGEHTRDRIAPTLVAVEDTACPLMQEEIFGPILPVLSYQTLEEAISFVAERPKPLALYLFTRDRGEERTVLERLSFGGGCVNDTILHLTSPHMPFGGVGDSGMGAYHGKASFDTFTHYKSVLKKAAWPDLAVRYHPYTPQKASLLHRLLR